MNILGIDDLVETSSFSIINTLGQVVKSDILANNTSINTTNLKSGVYILRIQNEFTIKSKRFIVK